MTARVGIGPAPEGGSSLTVTLDLDAPTISLEQAFELMEPAHEACPYSRATRGNVDVTLTVGGSSTSHTHARATRERIGS